MDPIDGQLREGVGLLGSPCFEIPRSAQASATLDHPTNGAELRRLTAKNKCNLATIGLYLVLRWRGTSPESCPHPPGCPQPGRSGL
jgi:hypothetical protein